MAYVDITDLIFSTWGLPNDGPHWGHIRATIDRIAANNTGHYRTAVCPNWIWPAPTCDKAPEERA